MRVQQVLDNLTGNAIKFTESGEVVVSIDVHTCSNDNVVLRFAVRDTGTGIPAGELPRLFDSFTQLDESVTRRFGGTGLGLAISKRLAELMGGSIGATSEVGRGSTFYFTASFGVPEPEAALGHVAGADAVLVVDDNQTARDVLRAMLESLSFRVTTVDSGERALEELTAAARRGRAFSLVLLDWKMPGLSGLETLGEIRRLEIERQPSVVLMSAWADGELAAAASAAGVPVVLEKPISPSTLFDAMTNAMGGPASLGRVRAAATPLPRFTGSRMLLVEDNEINRQITEEMLRGAGIEVSTATGGRDALRILETQRFDAVLMDVQMPDMDGIEVTRLVKENPRHAKLPVIALTAHAMSGDRERFLAAGMDDYITKPVDEEVLLRVLARWLPHHEEATVRPGFDVPAGLRRLGGNEELYRRLIHEFRTEYANAGDQIRSAFVDGRKDEAAHLIHTVKGVAASLSAVRVADAAARLEKAIRNGGGHDDALRELEDALTEARSAPSS
jgi:two-component system sensor histidine kinase/response regulator